MNEKPLKTSDFRVIDVVMRRAVKNENVLKGW
jgi:hypothetical protein